jgi:hypothetical protein
MKEKGGGEIRKNSVSEQVGVVVMPETCIWEVLGLNFSSFLAVLTSVFQWFFHVYP